MGDIGTDMVIKSIFGAIDKGIHNIKEALSSDSEDESSTTEEEESKKEE